MGVGCIKLVDPSPTLQEVNPIRGLMCDEEWGLFALVMFEQWPKRSRLPINHRRVLDAMFWIVRTGSL
jgi:hypothetical protein